MIDRTFRAGEKFRPIHAEARKMQFLYADGTDAHFMDEESYEQIALPEASLAEPLKWVKPNESVDMLYIDGEPADLQLTGLGRARGGAHGARVSGDTAAGGGNKPATLETGRDRERPAVGEHRGQDQGRHALGLVHVACVGPSSGARRFSPSISTISRSRPLDDLFERDAPALHTRARARNG